MWNKTTKAYANVRQRVMQREPAAAIADEGMTPRPEEQDEALRDYVMVEKTSGAWKSFVSFLGFVFGLAVLPSATFIASFGIADRPPALFAIPCALSIPGYFLCDHHTIVIAASWLLQTFLYLEPEYSMISGVLLPLLFIWFIYETHRWVPFESDMVSLKRFVAAFEQYGLNPLSTLYRQLRIAAVVLAVAKFVAKFGFTWRHVCQAVAGSEGQFPWCFVMIILGMGVSFATWSYWTEYMLPTDGGGSLIFVLMVLGHIFVRQLQLEKFRHSDQKMQISRMVMIGHFFCLVMSYQRKWWMLPRSNWLWVTFANVVYFSLLVLMNRRGIAQALEDFLAGPKQDTAEVMHFQDFQVRHDYFNPTSQ